MASDCIEWPGYKNADGYGATTYRGKTVRAHRLAFYKVHGYWPEVVMHSCDNPACINPIHLIGGTQLQNIADRHAKGRDARHGVKGSRHPNSKLTEEDVRHIRSSELSGHQLGKRYGVSYQLACDIKSGKRWKHVL